MSRSYLITSLAPLVFGDGRPFTEEAGSQSLSSLPLPPPSTLAGGLRSATYLAGLKKGEKPNWKADASALKKQACRGPLWALTDESGQQLCLPLPASILLLQKGEASVTALMSPRPGASWGCRIPGGLDPMRLSDEEEWEIQEGILQPSKADRPDMVPLSWLEDWLLGKRPASLERKLLRAARERRIHVGLTQDTLTAQRGRLFATEGVWYGGQVWRDPETNERKTARMEIAADFDGPEVDSSGLTLLLGGERRAALARPLDPRLLEIPDRLASSLPGARQVVMLLATPGKFRLGWKPGWLGEDFTGTPPGTNTTLMLRGAAMGSRQHVSGWDLEKRGPKPVSWLVPAGAAYFFDVVKGSPEDLASAWLQPVADDPQDRLDGWSLACWGLWPSA
jgi:CRISPR-associated protein Cmr3